MKIATDCLEVKAAANSLEIVRLRLGRLQLADYLEVRDAAISEVKVREVDWMCRGSKGCNS